MVLIAARFAVAIVILLVRLCTAFNPSWNINWFGGLLTIPSDGLRFEISQWGRPHEDMTEKGVTSRYTPYFGIDPKTPSKSMIRARQEIIDGSKVVDDHKDILEEAENPTCHFDDETLFESNERLRLTRNVVAAALTVGDVTTARNKLGRALHTLQDFYSHTNWVELGFKEISKNLGRSWPLELGLAPDAVNICQDCEYRFPSELTGKAVVFLDETCRKLATSDPMSTTSKAIIFYCMINPVLRGALFGVSPTCDKNLEAPFIAPASTYLTSGYFGAKSQLHLNKAAGKCSHGGPFDRDARGREGICKDTQSKFMSPHWYNHKAAADLADLATIQYLDDLKDDLCPDVEPKNCVRLKLLYGLGPTLSFAIDTTGSMGPVISGVRNDAIRIVNERRGSDDAPILYVLARYNDPLVPDAQTFTDADQFIAAIASVTAGGDGDGGDCPELAMAGLLHAIGATSSGGQIFLWTDAAAKDAAEAGDVVAAAKKKNIQVNVFQFVSSCSTADGFDVVTSKTGGRFYNGLGTADSGSTSNLATTLTLENIVDIWSLDLPPYAFGAKRALDRSLSFDIPVDSSIDFLGLSLSGIGILMSITHPDGSVVEPTDAGVNRVALVTGIVQTIENPVAGLWKVHLTGNNAFSLSIFGKSTIQFSKFEFVELRGSHHEGWYKVQNTPLTGSIVMGHAILDGEHTDTTFEMRSLTGTTLRTLSLTSGTGNGSFEMPANYFYGNVSVPNEAFNVYMIGKDSAGLAYQRVVPGILDIVKSNSTSTNTTIPSTSTTSALPSNGRTSTSHTRYMNSTLTTTVSHSSKTYEATSKTITSKAVCLSCQPTPTNIASTTLTRTIIYHTSCPIIKSGSVTYSTSTVTTTIAVPCYSECHKPLPIISPCTSAGSSSILSVQSGSPATTATTSGSTNSVGVDLSTARYGSEGGTAIVSSSSVAVSSITRLGAASISSGGAATSIHYNSAVVNGAVTATPTAGTGGNGTSSVTVLGVFTGGASLLGARSIGQILVLVLCGFVVFV